MTNWAGLFHLEGTGSLRGCGVMPSASWAMRGFGTLAILPHRLRPEPPARCCDPLGPYAARR
jgi:hypothetical protein